MFGWSEGQGSNIIERLCLLIIWEKYYKILLKMKKRKRKSIWYLNNKRKKEKKKSIKLNMSLTRTCFFCVWKYGRQQIKGRNIRGDFLEEITPTNQSEHNKYGDEGLRTLLSICMVFSYIETFGLSTRKRESYVS